MITTNAIGVVRKAIERLRRGGGRTGIRAQDGSWLAGSVLRTPLIGLAHPSWTADKHTSNYQVGRCCQMLVLDGLWELRRGGGRRVAGDVNVACGGWLPYISRHELAA